LVIVWHLVGLGARHLDVVAVHAVVVHAQSADAAALALAAFQILQKLIGVLA